MKKMIALIPALCMVFALTACGEKTSEKDEEKEQATAEVTEEQENVGTEDTDPTEQPEEQENKKTESPYDIFESMDAPVVDNGEYTVTIGAPESNGWYLVCPVTVENDSGKDIHVSSNAIAVNGKAVGGLFFVEAAAGQEGTGELYLYELKVPEEVTRLSMEITVMDADFESVNYLVDIYPQGMDAYEEYTPKRAGKDELFDQNGVYAAIVDYDYDDKDFSFDYVIINDSDEVYTVNMEIVAINGFGISDSALEIVLPGTYAEDIATSYEYEHLMTIGLTEVTSVTVDVSLVKDILDPAFDEEITLYPSGKEDDRVFKYTSDTDDVVLVDNDDFKLTLATCTYDEYFGTDLIFVLENKTGESISVDAKNMKINGKDYDSGWLFISATDGRDTVDAVTVYSNYMEEMDIRSITSVELTLEARDNYYRTILEDTVKAQLI